MQIGREANGRSFCFFFQKEALASLLIQRRIDDIGNGRITSGAQGGGDAGAVFLRSVLAHFPLRFDAGAAEAEGSDAAVHHGAVVVVELGDAEAGGVDRGEGVQDGAVFDDGFEGPVDVYGRIVPGGDGGLGLVPGGRDVGVRAGKDGDGGAAVQGGALRVGGGQVGLQGDGFAVVVCGEGDVGDRDWVFGDEDAEIVFGDEADDAGQVFFFEGGPNVHGAVLQTAVMPEYWTMRTGQFSGNPADQSRQQAVFDRLRQAILAGTLPAGARLPPTRHLAQELSVARQTVVVAYERLAAEGYVRGRAGSGTFVSADLPDAIPPLAAPAISNVAPLSARGAALAGVPINAGTFAGLLAPGVPAPELFPVAAWASCTARVLRGLSPELTGYPDAQGLLGLRLQIAAHLAATRGLIADPETIVVTSGTQLALRIAADLLLDPGDPAWVENPGYIAGRGALRAAGAVPVAVPSDAEGLDVAAGIRLAPGARLALVAPSHATPLGGALPIGRRLALLEWAGRAEAWVLEDDCDSEFRWEGRPLPPLASLDRAGRVIYCGTFSKNLAPGLRLGFAVVPGPLLGAFVRARALIDRGPPALQQAVLAEFMRQGRLGPHIRRMRTEYAKRREALLGALGVNCPGVRALPAPGGLHMVVEVADEIAVVAAARARGLAVAPLGAYFWGAPGMSGLVLGFATVPVALAGDVARRLAGCL